MMSSAWVANTLEEVVKICKELLDKDVNDIDMTIRDTDRDNAEQYLSIVIRRFNEQEGDDETAGKSNKNARAADYCP